ncbi:PAS domain-containing protein [Nitriliruptoraceae bacterium ZYF776]|nr:PAS domain-containing protein [Profundirhabdus halotolerans]
MRLTSPNRDPRARLALRDPEAILDAVTVTRADGTIVAVNRGFTRLHGYRPDQVVGATPRVLNSGFQGASTYADLWATVRSGRVWVGELVDRGAGGRLRSIRSEVTPFHDRHGRLVRLVAVQRELDPVLADDTRDGAGYLRVSSDGRCVGADARAAARLAAEPTGLLGHGWLHRLDRFDVEAVCDAMELSVETGRRFHLDVLDPWGDAARLTLVPAILGGGSWSGVTVLFGADAVHAGT